MTILRKLKDLWMAFANVVGQVQTALLLSIIYHIALGPLGLISRVAGSDLLGLRRPEGNSYAEPLARISTTIERAQRQF